MKHIFFSFSYNPGICWLCSGVGVGEWGLPFIIKWFISRASEGIQVKEPYLCWRAAYAFN